MAFDPMAGMAPDMIAKINKGRSTMFPSYAEKNSVPKIGAPISATTTSNNDATANKIFKGADKYTALFNKEATGLNIFPNPLFCK